MSTLKQSKETLTDDDKIRIKWLLLCTGQESDMKIADKIITEEKAGPLLSKYQQTQEEIRKRMGHKVMVRKTGSRNESCK